MTEPLILLGAALAFALAMLLLNLKTRSRSSRVVSYAAMWAGFILATMALGRIAVEVLA